MTSPRSIKAIHVQDVDELSEVLRKGLGDTQQYKTIDQARIVNFVQLLDALLVASPKAWGQVQLPPSMQIARYALQVPKVELVALSESSASAQGLPQIVWRMRKHPPRPKGWILQAPHRFFDKRTGDLAIAIFSDLDPRNAGVLLLNTKHRYAQKDGSRGQQAFNPSDVCHNPGHAFSRVTERVMVNMATNRVVQIHGFGEGLARRSEKTRNALAIVSSGIAQRASLRSQALVKTLRKHFGPQILLFPRDTQQLGATTNIQGRISRNYASFDPALRENGFVHIELSSKLRQELLSDPLALAKFQDALFSTMSTDFEAGE